MSYYAEKERAIRRSDFLINEILYVHKKEIDLGNIEFVEEPNFKCNFMNFFRKRLELYIKRDSNIIIDEKKGIVRYKK